YVSAHTSENVLRIAAIATTTGISTAGSVPKTNSRMTTAPSAPIAASTRRLGPLLDPLALASSSASWPVTFAVIPDGRPAATAARIFAAPLFVETVAGPGG